MPNERTTTSMSTIYCDRCQMLSINGTACHEIGCPNMGKVWEDGEWVKYHECYICGCDVRLGDNCDCQDDVEGETDQADFKRDLEDEEDGLDSRGNEIAEYCTERRQY